jgi:hypothetical protein
MKLDNRKLAEVWRAEYEATRNEEAAVGAVATAVMAQLELPGVAPPRAPVEVRVVVVHEHRAPKPHHAADLVGRVLSAVAAEFDLHQGAPGRRRRLPTHVDARSVAAAVLRDSVMSLPAIARAVGYRDHTSVLYVLRRVEERLDLQAAVARVHAALQMPAAVRAASAHVEAA